MFIKHDLQGVLYRSTPADFLRVARKRKTTPTFEMWFTIDLPLRFVAYLAIGLMFIEISNAIGKRTFLRSFSFILEIAHDDW